MKVHLLNGPPPTSLASALAEFESPFSYPLGPDRTFHISHGEDYSLFFRAQGAGMCFVAEHQNRILGVLGAAIRRIWMPNGRERLVGYVGDLKIAAEARGGLVLGRLARAADAWLRPKVDAAYGVVMDGTGLTPQAYTHRAGIPAFREVGRLAVLRVSGDGGTPPYRANCFLTTPEAGLSCYQQLSRGRNACPIEHASGRSQMAPVWLRHPEGLACGLLEDTRRAKRLMISDGSELLSAHLSCFAYASLAAGAELIREALLRTIALDLTGLFLAVPADEAASVCESLAGCKILPAPATVYGTGFEKGDWNINTSEI